jgi:ketosteroid isomerase-like protein
MSQENVEVVRRSIEAWNQRDEDAGMALWHPYGEIDWSRSQGPLNGVYRGHGERQMFWNEFRSTFEENKLEIHGFTEAGAEVVVPNTALMRGRDGIEVTASSTFVFTVEHGLITRMRLFQEHAEALEAVGLSEQDAHAES